MNLQIVTMRVSIWASVASTLIAVFIYLFIFNQLLMSPFHFAFRNARFGVEDHKTLERKQKNRTEKTINKCISWNWRQWQTTVHNESVAIFKSIASAPNLWPISSLKVDMHGIVQSSYLHFHLLYCTFWISCFTVKYYN